MKGCQPMHFYTPLSGLATQHSSHISHQQGVKTGHVRHVDAAQLETVRASYADTGRSKRTSGFLRVLALAFVGAGVWHYAQRMQFS